MTEKKQVDDGCAALLRGEFAKSMWQFNAALYLKNPTTSKIQDPTLWQRGICSYYAGQFEEGKLQFASDMAENGSDAEEIIWHFICQCSSSGLEQARLMELQPVPAGAPPIPPMEEVVRLFQGTGSSKIILKSAAPSEPDSSAVVKSYNGSNALAYAHFYIGLYKNIHGQFELARRHFQTAANFRSSDYMGSVMRMHFSLFSRKHPAFSSMLHSSFPRIIHGGWQLSRGHLIQTQEIAKPDILRDLLEIFDAGICAFDCGDIYVGVEELYGMLIKAHCIRGGKREGICIHTKFVPDLEVIQASAVDRRYLESVLRRSLNRLGVQSLDLVQFHWWDNAVPGAVETLKELHYFVDKGWVKKIGLTNFDTATTKCFLGAGIPIASTQVQFSLLDRRPLLSGLVQLCSEHNVAIFAYGVLAGGFLTDKWLGKKKPNSEDLENRSLVKYLLIIEEFGGWCLFQQLLEALRKIADQHGSVPAPDGKDERQPVSVAMVAISYVLGQDQVTSVILGAHGNRHLYSNLSACQLELSKEDLASIECVLQSSKGPEGGVYSLERNSHHANIMKYNLNQVNGSLHLEELCHRYLILHFEGHPVEATRTGYRHAKPPNFDLEQSGFPASTGGKDISFSFDYDQTLMASMKAVNFDHLCGPCSEAEIRSYCEKVKSLLDEASCISTATLTSDQLVDLEIVIHGLKHELLQWNEIQSYKRDPLFYLPLNAILYLLPVWGPVDSLPNLRSHPGAASLSAGERLQALLSRLRAIPNSLIQAHRNLTESVLPFVETAIEICESFSEFLSDKLPFLARDSECCSDCVSVLNEIDDAAAIAASCVKKYKSFLGHHLLPVSSILSGVGKDLFESVLQYGFFIDSSSELLELGEKHFQRVKGELESLAAEIDPSRSWKEITKDEIQCMHPSAKDLLDSYMAEIQRCRQHVVEHGLVSFLPDDEKILGFWMPQFLTPFSPVGDYLNPSPFAEMATSTSSASSSSRSLRSRVGHLMLHSIEDKELSAEEEEMLLMGHDYTWISVVCPHESYPGHHLQALRAQTHPRILRKYHESTVFYEGWGLYTEQLAYETGFFKKEQAYKVGNVPANRVMSKEMFEKYARLTQLRLQLWRSARIILDVKLNKRELTVEECSEFLQREVMFNPGAIKGEVFMYLSRPGYASTYIAGYLQIMQLREVAREKLGASFDLTRFHDRLLEHGCIPFILLSKVLEF